MLNLLKLAAVAGIATDVKRRTGHALRIAIRSALAGAMFVLGAAFLTAAGWLKLSELHGAIAANLVVGGILLAMGLITYIVGVVVPQHYKRRYAPPAQTSMAASATVSGTPRIDFSTLATLAAVGVAAGRMFRR